MTSGNLFSKLMREDCKRRTWAFALVFLAFFFTLPIGLALAMENAANTQYFAYNNYRDFVQDASMPLSVYQEKLLELKTKVVFSQAAFGNGMVVFLMMVAAVVIGVSNFSYLHNKKKIDFYHSIPVRREVLYSARYTGGILIVGISYLINLLLMFGVAMAYGVGTGYIAGTMAGGFALNMLFFLLLYATVVVAMMMTGNIVVGILATGVFYFFLPAIMMLLIAYCDTFFVTASGGAWYSNSSPFTWGTMYLSPFSMYITALTWDLKEIGKHVPELICSGFAVLALFFLGLQLYRIRPSEAAGKAMAFKRTMAPIRILLVLGCGLAGGMFFWVLQSKLRWGLFGVVMSVILTHCIVEIIYHFDFKKLFTGKIQLAVCLSLGVLVFLSFRYDWYGYDSYLPKTDQVVSASLDLDIDHSWLNNRIIGRNSDGEFELSYESIQDKIEENMEITDMNLVMPIVEEGMRRALEGRDERLGIVNQAVVYTESVNTMEVNSVSYIGGADGPTSVFIAGKAGGGAAKQEKERYFTGVTVCYQLSNGRRVRRSYQLPLSSVMDTYDKLYCDPVYKEGIYNIFKQTPDQLNQVIYREAGSAVYTSDDSRMLEQLLNAYKADFMALDTKTRIEEVPIGSLTFVTNDGVKFLQQAGEQMRARGRGGYWDMSLNDFNQSWPVYPSFTHTREILKHQGADSGSYFTAGRVKSVTISVQNLFYDADPYRDLPKDEELANIQAVNPRYTGDGNLKITKPEDIETVMNALMEDEFRSMDQFQEISGTISYCEVEMQNGVRLSGLILADRVTPEFMELFAGLPDVSLEQ